MPNLIAEIGSLFWMLYNCGDFSFLKHIFKTKGNFKLGEVAALAYRCLLAGGAWFCPAHIIGVQESTQKKTSEESKNESGKFLDD